MMTDEQFEEYLALYGAEIGKWPNDLAVKAGHLLDENPHLSALVADYASLDAQLSLLMDEVPVNSQQHKQHVRSNLLMQFEEQQLFKPRTLIGSFMTVAASVLFAVMLAVNSGQNAAVAWEEDYIDFALGFSVEEAVYNQPEAIEDEGSKSP